MASSSSKNFQKNLFFFLERKSEPEQQIFQNDANKLQESLQKPDSKLDNIIEDDQQETPKRTVVKRRPLTAVKASSNENNTMEIETHKKIEAVATASKAKTPQKRYALKFNDDWTDSTHADYQDWLEKVPNGCYRFKDLACNKLYDVDYFAEHVTKDVHKKNVIRWRDLEQTFNKLDKTLSVAKSGAIIEAKIVYFLTQKNAPMAWGEDIASLFKSCFPTLPELKHVNLYQKKCNWIAQGLSEAHSDDLLSYIKTWPYSLMFDETSNKHYKYALFMVRFVDKEFTRVENMTLSLEKCSKEDSEATFNLYKSHIVDHKVDHNMVALCLDNCNAMRGENNSMMTRIREQRPLSVYTPCLCHILNICEKHAFRIIPDHVENFYRNVYVHFSRSLQKTQDFLSLQKELGMSESLFIQPAHTRWLSWAGAIIRIKSKWEALKEYFFVRVASQQEQPRKLRRIIDIKRAKEGDNEIDNEDVHAKREREKAIMKSLDQPQTYLYSKFLEHALRHSSKYVGKFEEDNMDVSGVYHEMKDYCVFYVNKLRKFEHLGISIEEIMRSVENHRFERNYMMKEEEFKDDLLKPFADMDLSKISSEDMQQFVSNTRKYYLTILRKFGEYVKFDQTIFQELRALNLSENVKPDVKIWKECQISSVSCTKINTMILEMNSRIS